MSVKPPSALTCPGAHDPTSPQSFPMTFTKSSKSPKLPKISDNIVEQTSSTPNHFCFLFFFFPHVLVGHCRSWFLLFPSRGLIIVGVSRVSSVFLSLFHPYRCIFVSQRCSRYAPVGARVKAKRCRSSSFSLLHRFCSIESLLSSNRCCSHISVVFLLYRINFL